MRRALPFSKPLGADGDALPYMSDDELVSWRDGFNRTALHLASHSPVVRGMLSERPAVVRALAFVPDANGATPYRTEATRGLLELVLAGLTAHDVAGMDHDDVAGLAEEVRRRRPESFFELRGGDAPVARGTLQFLRCLKANEACAGRPGTTAAHALAAPDKLGAVLSASPMLMYCLDAEGRTPAHVHAGRPGCVSAMRRAKGVAEFDLHQPDRAGAYPEIPGSAAVAALRTDPEYVAGARRMQSAAADLLEAYRAGLNPDGAARALRDVDRHRRAYLKGNGVRAKIRTLRSGFADFC